MERRTFFVSLMITFSFVQNVHAINRIFTYGAIHEYSTEQVAINLAVNNASSLENVSITLKRFNATERTSLFNQASVFLQQNIIALIEGSQTKTSACALSTVTGIPLIRLHGDSRSTDQCEKAIQMSAEYRAKAHATLDILHTFQWEKIALLFDEDRSHEAGYFHTISQSKKLNVMFVQFSVKGELEDQTASISRAVEQIANMEPDVILLYTNKENVELLLTQKTCQDLNGYKWILQGEVSQNVSSHTKNKVLALKLPYNENLAPGELKNEVGSNYNDIHKELAAVAYDAVQVINKAINIEPCLSINGTVITSKEMFTCLRKVNLDGITGPIKFSEDGKRAEMELEIWNLQNNSFKKIGTWNSTKSAVFFEHIRRNMHKSSPGGSLEGRQLKVVVAEDSPFVMRQEDKDGQISFTGYCIDLLNELAAKLHFTYEIHTSPDKLYGGETENGTWNGLIGELINKRADIALAALTITESREKVVDFSLPFIYYTDDILLKKSLSHRQKINFLQFLDPFHNHVWFATLASLVLISVAVFVINYFSPYGYKDENGRGTSEEFSFFNSVWYALACMLQQGADNQPRSLSGRILAGCYWFCILIWVSTYTANLAAFLTVTNALSPINNLEDLLSSSYTVAILKSGSTHEYLKTTQYETHRKLWHRIKAQNSLAVNSLQAVKWVREKHEYVFIYDAPIVRHYANSPPCDLTTVPGLSTAKGLALAFQANDPLVQEFSLAILSLHENSFLDGLQRKWWESNHGCPNDQETTLTRQRIDLTSMLGVYLVMGIGVVLAFLVLIAEIIWKRKEKRKLKRSNIHSIQVRPQIN